MSCAIPNPLLVTMVAFSKEELCEIIKAAALLLDAWIVDPIIDTRLAATPSVWVHPNPVSNDATFSLGIMKQGGQMLITGRHHDGSDLMARGSAAGGGLRAAFNMLSNAMLMLRDGHSGSLEREWK